VTRRDKQLLNQHLLRAGASIDVMNAVRKHVSAVKGGRLALLAAPREVITLALSDVPDDALATVGSGPAVADPSSFATALRRLRAVTPDVAAVPASVWRLLEGGAGGSGPEDTPKPGDARLGRARAVLIGSNRTALLGAARAARELGYVVAGRPLRLGGEAASCARELVAALPEPLGRALCLLGGGETHVTARGSTGKGGRSQELALAAAAGLAGSRWSLLCAGTDGVDGPTDAAGAFCDGRTLARGGRRRAARALAGHDSYSFFAPLGDLFRPGPTGTNVMDLAIALHPAPGAD
jgi:hydroxypyruvate reductase